MEDGRRNSIAVLGGETSRRALLQALGAGGAFVLTGCGSGGSSDAGTTSTTTVISTTASATPTPTATPTATPTPTASTSTTTVTSYGSTGWNSPSYISTATVPALADFVAIAAASHTFHEANTSTGEKETVSLAAYLMSRFQVTNANWKAYCVATGAKGYPRYWTSDGSYPAGKADHPVLFVSATQAEAFAAWLSTVIPGYAFRLPSEGEWEYAALGTNTTWSWPWGTAPGVTYANGTLSTRFNYNGYCSTYLLNGSGITTLTYYDDTVVTQLANGGALTGDTAPLTSVVSISATDSVTGWQYDSSINSFWADFANSDQFEALVNVFGGYTTPVGAFPAGASWCGLLDMAGNAYEWTSTTSVAANGIESGTAVRNVRGASWYAVLTSCRSTYRGEGRAPSGNYNSVGFRLAATRL